MRRGLGSSVTQTLFPTRPVWRWPWRRSCLRLGDRNDPAAETEGDLSLISDGSPSVRTPAPDLTSPQPCCENRPEPYELSRQAAKAAKDSETCVPTMEQRSSPE